MFRALATLGRHSVLAQPTAGLAARTSCRALSTKSNEGFSFLAADQTMAAQMVFHKLNMGLMVLTPVAFLVAPTPLAMPVDIGLSLVIPLHAHIGMSWIFTDYLPGQSPTGALRMVMAGATCLAIIGLLKVSVTGDGLIGTLKATWSTHDELKKKREQ
mmetsp:Transcript_8280/g.13409  ORF Transcript_8280/g.13409 Transcript_8280/m.13409 type:complete len:158 (-) Transcript_8280:1158-1631(-)